MKKTIALLLLFGMLCSFAACAEEDNTDNAVTTKDPNESTSESYELDKYGREIVPSALPEGLNFDGTKITILSRQATSIFDCTNEFYVEEDSGNPVDSAVYNRHRETEEELGVTLNVEVAPGDDHNTYMNLVRKSHAAGDGAYDILAFYAYHGVNMAVEGMYYNLHEAPYIDLTKPWWNQNFVEEMTMMDQLYFIAGDMSLTGTMCTHAIFFNKLVLENIYNDQYNLYDTVLAGDWTVDLFSELVKGTYQDLNGSSSRDDEDLYGFGASGISIPVDAYLDAFDLAITTKNEDGLPELTYGNEKTVDAFNILYDLSFNNVGTLFGPTTLDTYYMFQNKFQQSEMLFLIDLFHATDKLRDMEADYGVLPMFKYNAEQDGYYTNTADIYSLLAIASGSQNYETACAVFELMGQKSYEEVTPAYFEISLKQKYIRDNMDAQMYDMVLDGTRFNFGFVYSAQLGNPIWIWRDLISAKSNNFMSTYAGKEKASARQLEKLVEQFENIALEGF